MEQIFIKPELLAHNPNLNYSVEPSLQGINRLFVLPFEIDTHKTSSKRYNLPNIEIKNYNFMIDGKNVFDQPIQKW